MAAQSHAMASHIEMLAVEVAAGIPTYNCEVPMTPKRLFLLIVVGLLAVALAQNSQDNKANPISEEIRIPPGKENLPADQVFHNIEILKGKPASRRSSQPSNKGCTSVAAALITVPTCKILILNVVRLEIPRSNTCNTPV